MLRQATSLGLTRPPQRPAEEGRHRQCFRPLLNPGDKAGESSQNSWPSCSLFAGTAGRPRLFAPVHSGKPFAATGMTRNREHLRVRSSSRPSMSFFQSRQEQADETDVRRQQVPQVWLNRMADIQCRGLLHWSIAPQLWPQAWPTHDWSYQARGFANKQDGRLIGRHVPCHR